MPQHRRTSLRRRILTAGAASIGALLLVGAGRAAYSPPGPLFSGSGGLPLPLGLGARDWPPPQEMLLPPPSYLLPPPEETSEADAEFALPRRLLPIRRGAGHDWPPPQEMILPLPSYLLPPPQETSEADAEFALPRRLLPIRRGAGHSPPLHDHTEAVLLPDSEVLVLSDEPAAKDLMCAFEGGASSPARALGRLPGPGRHAYICGMPELASTILPLKAPLLLSSSTSAVSIPIADFPARTLLNWKDRLVFDSAVLDGGDVLVFAKGIIRRQVADNPADLHCVYFRHRDGAVVASFPAIASAQQYDFPYEMQPSKELQTGDKRTSPLLVFPGCMVREDKKVVQFKADEAAQGFGNCPCIHDRGIIVAVFSQTFFGGQT